MRARFAIVESTSTQRTFTVSSPSTSLLEVSLRRAVRDDKRGNASSDPHARIHPDKDEVFAPSPFRLPSHDVLRVTVPIVPRFLLPRVRDAAFVIRILGDELLDELLVGLVPHEPREDPEVHVTRRSRPDHPERVDGAAFGPLVERTVRVRSSGEDRDLTREGDRHSGDVDVEWLPAQSNPLRLRSRRPRTTRASEIVSNALRHSAPQNRRDASRSLSVKLPSASGTLSKRQR